MLGSLPLQNAWNSYSQQWDRVSVARCLLVRPNSQRREVIHVDSDAQLERPQGKSIVRVDRADRKNGDASFLGASPPTKRNSPCQSPSEQNEVVNEGSSANDIYSKKQALEEAVGSRQSQRAYEILQSLLPEDASRLSTWSICNSLLLLVTQKENLRICWSVYTAVASASLSYTALAKLLSTCIRGEDLPRAMDVFRDMQHRGLKPNMTTWCYLISSLSKTRRKGWPYANTAYRLWQELQSEGDVQSDIDASYYATGMMALTGVGKVREAAILLEEMQVAGLKPDIRAFNILMRGYANASELGSMERLLEVIQAADLLPSASTYNTMINAYVSNGLNLKGYEMLQKASRGGVTPDVWAYTSLMKGFVRSKDMPQVMQVLDDMKAAGIQPNVVTLSTLMDGCVKAGMMQSAEELISSMQAAGVPPNIVTFNTLLQGYAKNDDMQGVKGVFQRMEQAGVEPREDTFNTLMKCALASQNKKIIPELFQQLLGLNLRPDSLSYTALITAFARLQQPQAALGAFAELKESIGVDGIALNSLITALANTNRMVEAEGQLQRAARLANKRGQPPPVEAYSAVLKAYTRQNDAEAALDLLQEFEDRGGRPDNALVDLVVTVCVKTGNFKRALQVVRTMERRGNTVDKSRIKQTLEVVLKLQEQGLKKKAKPLYRNENLERLKFWLGLRNSYYGSDSET